MPSEAVTRCDATSVVPAAVKTDILFVIDDSISMGEEQANLRDNLAAFIDALAAAPIANEFQIGITTTSVEGYGATSTEGQAYLSGPAAGTPFPDGTLIAIRQTAPAPQPGRPRVVDRDGVRRGAHPRARLSHARG